MIEAVPHVFSSVLVIVLICPSIALLPGLLLIWHFGRMGHRSVFSWAGIWSHALAIGIPVAWYAYGIHASKEDPTGGGAFAFIGIIFVTPISWLLGFLGTLLMVIAMRGPQGTKDRMQRSTNAVQGSELPKQ